MQTIKDFIEQPFMNELITLALTLIGLFVAFRVVSVLTKRLRGGSCLQHIDPSARSFLSSFLNVALKLILVVVAAGIVGVPTSSLVAVLGSASLAVGLALQGSLSNFAGGMMVLLFKPFSVDDLIMEPGGELGTVKDISILYTTIRTFDMRNIILPNGNLANGRIVNYSKEDYMRADLEFTVAYGSDVSTVCDCLLSVAKSCPLLLSEPAPQAVLTRLDDSAIVFVLRAYCSAQNYPSVPGALTEPVMNALNKANIEIPFPQLDVHLKQ